MKKAIALTFLIGTLLGSCTSPLNLSREETLAKLQTFDVMVNASSDFTYPSKYTSEEKFASYTTPSLDSVIENASIYSELDCEKLYFHSRLNGQEKDDIYFEETYIFVSGDKIEILSRGSNTKNTRESLTLEEKSWESVVSSKIETMHSLISNSASTISSAILSTSLNGNIYNEDYSSSNEGFLNGTFDYALNGVSGTYTFTFENYLLTSWTNFNSTLSLRWNLCETSTPNINDYE